MRARTGTSLSAPLTADFSVEPAGGVVVVGGEEAAVVGRELPHMPEPPFIGNIRNSMSLRPCQELQVDTRKPPALDVGFW